ncbi:unnamed protein product [Trichogramma brassicae]|uniref:Uncharacterized protein n=1 Tax=Trichogramma brassicae TaxID=86971 RepID=A0A6H5HSH6_9HYME|nr:unnamed protein product [Trichogramma brassicae]
MQHTRLCAALHSEPKEKRRKRLLSRSELDFSLYRNPVGNGGLSTSSGRLVYRYYPATTAATAVVNNNNNNNKPKTVQSDTVLRSYCSSSGGGGGGKGNDGRDAKDKQKPEAATTATQPQSKPPRSYEKMIEAYASEIETIKRQQHRQASRQRPASPRNILSKLPFDAIMSNLTKVDRTKPIVGSNSNKNPRASTTASNSSRRVSAREPSLTPRRRVLVDNNNNKDQPPPKREYCTKSSSSSDNNNNGGEATTSKKPTPKLVRVADLRIKLDRCESVDGSQPNEGKRGDCGKLKSPKINTYAKIVKAVEETSSRQSQEQNTEISQAASSNPPRAKNLPGWLTPEYKWQNKLKVYPRDPNYDEQDEDPSLVVFEQDDKSSSDNNNKQSSKSKKGSETERSETEAARTTRLKRKRPPTSPKSSSTSPRCWRSSSSWRRKSPPARRRASRRRRRSRRPRATADDDQDDSELPPENTKRENTIDQTYRFRRVSGGSSNHNKFVPIVKREDGTLIDYGMTVPTRKKRQRKKSPPSASKQKNNTSNNKRGSRGGNRGGGGAAGGASNGVEPKKTASLPECGVPELRLNRATNLSYILERASVPSPKSRIPRLLSHNNNNNNNANKRKKKLEEEQKQLMELEEEKKLKRSETRILERATFPELKSIIEISGVSKAFNYSPWLDRFHTRKADNKPQQQHKQCKF